MIRTVTNPGYNYVFDYRTGYFARWGNTYAEDPQYSPVGPEILDIELSTICSNGCSFCYKDNNFHGKNMSLNTFKILFSKFPKNLTQIAFGIGDIDANPDLWKIMEHCREHKIVPNITINGAKMTSELYDNLVKYCGAVAASAYGLDTCYDAVQELTKRGLRQVNIHCLLSEETLAKC